MAWLSEGRPDWSRGPLLPVAVQDVDDGTLLMVAWANAEAVAATETTGEAHFWSRSREELWRKGATSGNLMALVDMAVDCDGDAIRYRVRLAGPACHTGARSCFAEVPAIEATVEDEPPFDLEMLAAVVAARRGADPEGSYTARLLAAGPRRPAEKLTEEAGELSAATLAGTDDEVVAEAADLLYHLLVLLESRGVTLGQVTDELAARHSAR